jgi:hypothetical protein
MRPWVHEPQQSLFFLLGCCAKLPCSVSASWRIFKSLQYWASTHSAGAVIRLTLQLLIQGELMLPADRKLILEPLAWQGLDGPLSAADDDSARAVCMPPLLQGLEESYHPLFISE